MSERGLPLVVSSESESCKKTGRLKPPCAPHLLHSVCVVATGGTFIKYILVEYGEALDHLIATAIVLGHIVQSEEETKRDGKSISHPEHLRHPKIFCKLFGAKTTISAD